MPKACKGESWKSVPPPSTALQREAFIYNCMDWLAKDTPDLSSTSDAFSLLEQSEWSDERKKDFKPSTSVGVSYRDLRSHSRKPCAFCTEEEGGRGVVANPFAFNDVVLVCETCMQG